MTDSRRPKQVPRPPETGPSGIRGNPDPEPPPPPEQQAFRSTFLWRFHRPDVIPAFRLVGDALCDLQNEAGAWGPKGDTPITWGELQAASEDLDHLVTYLDEVAGDRTAAELDEVSEALAMDASRWAGQLARVVLDMRRSLDRASEALAKEANDADPGTE